MTVMERNYDWFTQRRRARGLQLAHDQITKAFETVPLLHQAAQSFTEGNIKEAKTTLQTLYADEECVDQLRTSTFLELSKGAALVADYREDLLHLVKRADMLADYTKDAARCFEMLSDADIPQELCNKTLLMTGKLVQIVGILRNGVDHMSSTQVVKETEKVEEIEHEVDTEYLKTKHLFVKYGAQMNRGAIVIFDDLIEFIEHASDVCADMADYIKTLSSRE
jgi:predicted phosphate transport protein (TIGR00153 family)